MSRQVKPLLDLVDDAVERGDVGAIRRHISELERKWPRASLDYYGPEESVRPDLLRLVRDGLPLEGFLELAAGGPFLPHEAWPVLDELADELSSAQLAQALAALGALSPWTAPRLEERILASQEPELTRWRELIQSQRQAEEEEEDANDGGGFVSPPSVILALVVVAAVVGATIVLGVHGPFVRWSLRFASLVLGLLVLAVLRETIAGNESFSLPLADLFIASVLGGILTVWFGWIPVAAILSLYLVFVIISGLWERIAMR